MLSDLLATKADSRRVVLLNMVTVLVVFLLSAYLLAPRWVGYLSVSALNQLDTDFLYFDVIHNHLDDYSNILIANVVERVHSSFGLLLGASSALGAMGIDQGVQLVAFFYAQLLLGIAGIYFISRGLALGRSETALVIAFFLFSYFIQFGRYLGGPGFYNKVTVSCFAMSIAYVVIALFIHARYRTAMLLSAMLIYVHPVYSAVLLAMVGLYGVKRVLLDRDWEPRYALGFVLWPALALVPFLIGVLASSDVVVAAGIGDSWWEYLKAKTSNPFPLQDGLVIVIPSLLVFAISFLLLGRLAGNDPVDPFRRARWILGGVFSAWLIQIVFTELLPVSFVARLSLTRTTPFALFFAVTAYVVTVWRLRARDDSGLWLVLLLVPAMLGSSHLIADEVVRGLLSEYPMVLLVLGGYWSDFAIYPDILVMFLLLVAYAFRTGQLALPDMLRRALAERGWLMRVLFTLIALSLLVVIRYGWILLSVGWSSSLVLSLVASLLLLWWVLERLIPPLTMFAAASNILRTQGVWVTVALLVIIALPPGIRSAEALRAGADGDADVTAMWHYIEQHTEKNEMVLVVPFFDTRKYPVMPLRPVFIDWSDAQYVLYDHEILDDVMERLRLIGMKLDKAMEAERCEGGYQYLDAMCRRKLFESLSTDYSDVWRDNLPRMREIAPNLTYVLMNTRYVEPSDEVLFTSGEISLIRL